MTEQDNSQARTLYFHTGIHKTGSTALQAYFFDNQSVLTGRGIGYEFPGGGDKFTGNGHYLFSSIFFDNVPDSALDEILISYFAGNHFAICSSEDFTRFGVQEWDRIRMSCERLGIIIKIVTFVRDIADYYFSLHGQLVKGGDSHTTFENFANQDQYRPVLNSLRSLIEVFGRDAVSLTHYESVAKSLGVAFLSVVGISSEGFDDSSLQQVVNRSLTSYEKEIMAKVTSATRSEYSRELSTLLINRRPNLREGKTIEPHVIEVLTHRHSEDVSWINQTFFNGLDVLKISANSLGAVAGESLNSEVRCAIDKDVAEWCMSQMKSTQSKAISYISERLRTIDWNNAANAAVPDDFDPVAYLMLNEDVLKATAPPFRHFIDFGQHEVGRPWKWT